MSRVLLSCSVKSEHHWNTSWQVKPQGPDGVTPQELVREELTDPPNSVLEPSSLLATDATWATAVQHWENSLLFVHLSYSGQLASLLVSALCWSGSMGSFSPSTYNLDQGRNSNVEKGRKRFLKDVIMISMIKSLKKIQQMRMTLNTETLSIFFSY